jgi:methylated-DNA-[protein]-cysteine S-methyltransferase
MNVTFVRRTPFGPVALVWSEFGGSPKVVRILLSSPEGAADDRAVPLFPGSRHRSCREIDELSACVRAFLEGEAVSFSLDIAALSVRPIFQQRVLRAEHAIPRGSVSAYGLIAARLGASRAARAVGHALATNPFPILVPCHRAVRTDGSLGGFQGGPAMKRALLALEGVPFDASGRVSVPRFFYS